MPTVPLLFLPPTWHFRMPIRCRRRLRRQVPDLLAAGVELPPAATRTADAPDGMKPAAGTVTSGTGRNQGSSACEADCVLRQHRHELSDEASRRSRRTRTQAAAADAACEPGDRDGRSRRHLSGLPRSPPPAKRGTSAPEPTPSSHRPWQHHLRTNIKLAGGRAPQPRPPVAIRRWPDSTGLLRISRRGISQRAFASVLKRRRSPIKLPIRDG